MGAALAASLQPRDVLALIGQIGSGKTRFVQGVARGMGVPEGTVASPSFVLIKVYRGGRMPLFHADLFRLEKAPEAATVGLEDCFEEPGVTMIEWATKIPGLLPEEYLEVQFDVVDEKTRELTLVPRGRKYESRTWKW